MIDLQGRLAEAVRHFWVTRLRQAKKQGKRSGKKDQGARAAVTGAAQLDGLIEVVYDLLIEAGVPEGEVFRRKKMELPGFYRATKKWDLVVVPEAKRLVAALEFKSHVGSFGNNYNNRTEEAVGNATDIWTAYRDGAFPKHPRPWLGYVMLLEEAPKSTRPLRAKEPHFKVFEEFRDTSYATRYEILCEKLVRERLYDAACLILSDREGGPQGRFREPSSDFSFGRFVDSLIVQATRG